MLLLQLCCKLLNDLLIQQPTHTYVLDKDISQVADIIVVPALVAGLYIDANTAPTKTTLPETAVRIAP